MGQQKIAFIIGKAHMGGRANMFGKMDLLILSLEFSKHPYPGNTQ